MAYILQPGENTNVNTGITNGNYLIVIRKFRECYFSGTTDANVSVNNPFPKINILDSLPAQGQRWPRRTER